MKKKTTTKKKPLTILQKKTKLNKKNLLLALEANLGLVTPSCKTVGISRKTFYEYYKKDEEFAEAVDEINTTILDFVENQLFKNIKNGSDNAIKFYLQYKGKNRGYSAAEKVDHSGQIEIKIIDASKEDKKDLED